MFKMRLIFPLFIIWHLANLKMSNLQLELRMAKMETESATRAMREKAASLKECVTFCDKEFSFDYISF